MKPVQPPTLSIVLTTKREYVSFFYASRHVQSKLLVPQHLRVRCGHRYNVYTVLTTKRDTYVCVVATGYHKLQ
jgi:hypothetical protein